MQSLRSRTWPGISFSSTNHALPLRVVLVLHEIEDGVDVLVVNVPLGQNELLIDNGMVMLNCTNVASLVLVDDQVIGLDQTLGRDHALGLDDPGVIDVTGLLDHFLTVVVPRRRALVAVAIVAATVVPGRSRGGDDCKLQGQQRPRHTVRYFILRSLL